ncbi:MAG: PAS domain S-box protein [Glaciimonas sp.]|nr:PAS domain S-box protein [Glaciimonas sp.]
MKPPLARVSPKYFRFRCLMVGLLAVACLFIAVMSWETYSSFRERESAARAQAETYVQTIVVHVSDSIQLVDSALIGFANAIKALPAQERNSATTIGQLLAYHDSAPSDNFRTIFIDANGIGVVATKNVTVQGTSYADSSYFKAHLGKQAHQGLYVSEPMIGKITNKRIFIMSRRVESAQGEFLGVVAAPMDAARFASMFALARLNKDVSITLIHRGGKIIARAPSFRQSFATSLLHSSLFEKTPETSIKSFQANSSVDEQTTIYSSRALENIPLDVIVGVSVEPLGQTLQKNLLIGGAGILLMMTIMLLSAHVALRSYRRLELSKQALEESETRWKFALEGTGEGVWDWNVMSNEVHFSTRWSQMLGYAKNEIENNFDAWISRVHPDDKSHVVAKLQACLEGKTPVYQSEYRMQSKDGSWKWSLARGMVVSRDAAGQARRMIGTQVDITDRKQTEQAQVHRIIEAAPDPMLLIDNDGIIAFANVAAQAAFGYAFKELKGQNVDDLVPFSSRSSHAHYRKKFEASKNQHPSSLNRPLTAIHKDGTEFPVEISVSSFQLDGQSVAIASIRDITERKCAAELLQQSFTQLRRLSDHQENIKENERKRIAQDIHDDLGQNLLALKMDVDTLYARTGGTHPKLNKRVSVVLNNINATIKSVKSIMNDLRPAALELGLYPAVEWQLKQFERRTRIACKLVTVAHDAAVGLNADQTLAVFRILQESLANVVRHANATEVEIALSQDERGFLMQVKDNGKGLQPDDRRKANSFGLMGIKERIHALGGELIIASSPGNGTALSISIPVHSPHRLNNMQHLF